MAAKARTKAPRRVAPLAEPPSDPIDLGGGLELRFVEVNDLREQDVNARTMTNEMFERLQATIARDARLESLPLCAETSRGVEIVSGHHRVRASRAAGLVTIPVLVDVTGLTRAQIKAKQLAHNSLAGADDEEVLARIYQDIDDMEARLEAFVDEAKFMPPPDPVSVPGLSVSLETRTAVIAFLPYQQAKFRKAVEQVCETLDADEVYLTDLKRLGVFREVVDQIGKHYDVRALGAALTQLADVLASHLGKKPDRLADDWVPLVDVGGGRTAMVPPDAAEVIEQVVDRVRRETKDKTMPLWRVFELVGADYLAGVPSSVE